ncbi:Uncharacterized protein FWK35_00032267 [Aphis craccivora]|uniref:Uncharacterized protein n=1 Tax=Aphis craccivora TaxID=307492 RepID=A0A6G0W486_APHCR|nr:Uncharacterized protein FWK35_00032267 [Aphis craccivora]
MIFLTYILDYGFLFDHYETQEPSFVVYEDSIRVFGRSMCDHYFTRNRSSKELKTHYLIICIATRFPYGIRLFDDLRSKFTLICIFEPTTQNWNGWM